MIVVIVAVFFYFNSEIKEQKLDYVLDQYTLTLDKELKNSQMNALQLALVLSKNSALINALENDDEDLGYKILSDIMLSIKKDTGRYIRAQVITSEYNIFARSWDDVYAGMPLGDYRDDLKYFETHKNPRTSIEVGRRLGIKATVPVYAGEVFIGFVEVIDFFESITEFFRNMGVDLYVLLDDKYFETAVLMQENIIVDKYIVANRNYNFNNIHILKSLEFKQFKLSRVMHIDNKYLFYKTMHNGDGESIGSFVFVVPQKYLDYFRNAEDDISFLINVTRSSLYNVVKEDKNIGRQYDNDTINSLLYMKDIITKEDEEEYLQKAYNKLNEYTKDELIQYMLNEEVIKKIDGKIK
jgi:hypothetical protein